MAILRYIDNEYIINELGFSQWEEAEMKEFYISQGTAKIRNIIYSNSSGGNPDLIDTYTIPQQEAIKMATAIYTLYYWNLEFDFTNGSASVNFGGMSMSESKNYQGEIILPNVYQMLKNNGLIPLTEIAFIDTGKPQITNSKTPNYKDLENRVLKLENTTIALASSTRENATGITRKEWNLEAGNNIDIVKKPLEFKTIISSKGGEPKQYTGLSPINVDNTKNEISINDNNYVQLDKYNIFRNTNRFGSGNAYCLINYQGGISISNYNSTILSLNVNEFIYKDKNIPEQIHLLENSQKTNQIKFDSISENLTEHEKLILTNQVAIKVNEKNINELVLENKKQINFLGSYDSTFNYMKNDSVVSKDNYYISLIDNNKQPLNDKSSWFSGAPTIDIDLSKYYTIIEINNMLKPLEQRLVVIENDIFNNDILYMGKFKEINRRVLVVEEKVESNSIKIEENDIYYEEKFSDITGNVAIIDNKVESNINKISNINTNLTNNYYDSKRTLELLDGKVNTTYFDQEIVKKQNKLVAGKNIIIDETTNTISTNGDSDIWENIPINPVATGFNIPTINNYKKIKIQSKSNINLYTTIETDYMASWVAPNTLILGVENFISIPLTTNENSQFYVGGYINLSIAATGDAFFYVRYLKNGAFAITGTTRWTGEIIVKGVKK